MRKLIFIGLVIFEVVFIFGSQSGLAQSTSECSEYLAIASHRVDLIDGPESSGSKLIKDVEKKLVKAQITLLGVKNLLSKAKIEGFVTKSKFDHLMEDLNELESGLNKKTKFDSFNYILDQWGLFLTEINLQFDNYLKLSPADQNVFFAKMQLPIVFMTSHFVTFLETSHLKFKYQRMTSILSDMNTKHDDVILFLYRFEKNVLKFFSRNEFLACKA